MMLFFLLLVLLSASAMMTAMAFDENEKETKEREEELPSFNTCWELVEWHSKNCDVMGLHQKLKSMFDNSECNFNPAACQCRLSGGF